MKHFFKTILFSLIPLMVIVVIMEVGLRFAGFYYSDTPLMMASLRDNPTGVVNTVIHYNHVMGIVEMKKDPYQLWVPADDFNRQHKKQKKPGTLRVVTLGDSCTMGCTNTDATYPGLMQERLNSEMPGKFEVINAGVGSHSSFQGLQRFKHAVLPFKPDIITIFYGWNDHWITSVYDKDVEIKPEWQVKLINFFEKFRSYQAYHYLIAKIVGKKNPAEEKPKSDNPLDWIKFRVAPQDYLSNLKSFIEIAAANKIRIILVTAPTDVERMQPSPSNFPFPKEMLAKMHAQYNEIVREVARRVNIPLLDLEQIIDQETAGWVFSEDAVHFSPRGCQYIADRFVEKLKELGWA